MKTNIILSEKKWHESLFSELETSFKEFKWILINNKESFNLNFLNKLDINKIFIPHWSEIISESIYDRYECIVFHMTDLPYGRGGSPLQNLIVRGHKETMISALKVSEGIDAGPIYLKEKLDLNGTAKEIFINSNSVIIKMISEILSNEIIPIYQVGEPTFFKRRTPQESNIEDVSDLETVYDYIRMLDCEGYPNAFLESRYLKVEFFNAKFDRENLYANVRILKK